MGIDNTTRGMQEDPAEGLLFLAEAMGPGGSSGAIAELSAMVGPERVAVVVVPGEENGG